MGEGSCSCKSNGSSNALHLKLWFRPSLVGGHSCLKLLFWPSLVGGHSCLDRKSSPLIEVDDISSNTFFRAHIVISRALGGYDSFSNMELSSTSINIYHYIYIYVYNLTFICQNSKDYNKFNVCLIFVLTNLK